MRGGLAELSANARARNRHSHRRATRDTSRRRRARRVGRRQATRDGASCKRSATACRSVGLRSSDGTLMLALIFPGQGAQSDGFLHRLPSHPAVRATLDEASSVLGADVLTLDTPDALRSTVAVQCGLTVAGVAIARALADEGLTPDLSAGLSVGAYPAAVSCGALPFPDALKMVRRRAELMEAAYPSGYGLAAVSGLTEHELAALAARHIDEGEPPVYIGNVNAPRQIVMAGANTALDS